MKTKNKQKEWTCGVNIWFLLIYNKNVSFRERLYNSYYISSSIAILSRVSGIPISSFSPSASEIHIQKKLSEASLPLIPPNIIVS